MTADRPLYFVHAQETAGVWTISVPAVPDVRAEVRRIEEAEATAREAIAMVLGVSEDSFDVVVLPNLSQSEARGRVVALITDELHRRQLDETDPPPEDFGSLETSTQVKWITRWGQGLILLNQTFYGSSGLDDESARTEGLKVGQELVQLVTNFLVHIAERDGVEPQELIQTVAQLWSEEATARRTSEKRYSDHAPNCLRPVSPSRWASHAHTRNHRSPRGENHRPVHAGFSRQCVACNCLE